MAEFYVKDKYRTPFSLEPGGYDVKLYFKDKPPMVYDKVKYPLKYVRSAMFKNKNIEDYDILGPSK